MALTAEDVVRLLDLAPHPSEGGHFRETYRSGLLIPGEALSSAYAGAREASTAIYYLLTPTTFSAMHRLTGDEVFHFYLGDPVEMLQLYPDGTGRSVVLGTDLEQGMRPQVVVPGGVWQGARLAGGGRFALMGTTVAPGFSFEDFELGGRDALLREYPAHRQMILALTAG
jgi:predicted cupin superfamily sugar epimerase